MTILLLKLILKCFPSRYRLLAMKAYGSLSDNCLNIIVICNRKQKLYSVSFLKDYTVDIPPHVAADNIAWS